MTTSKVIYTIKFIGFTSHERSVLGAIFTLSRHRPAVFDLFQGSENGRPKIIIVDFDNSEAVYKWQKLCAQDNKYFSVPTVRITRSKSANTENYYAHRPFTATKILSVLEELVLKEFEDSEPLVAKEISSEKKPNSTLGQGAALAPMNSVLIMDNHLSALIQISVAVSDYTENIDSAENTGAALFLLKKNRYDMILMHAESSDIDDHEVYKFIKHDPMTRKLPCIILVDHLSTMKEIKSKLRALDSCLVKPVSKHSLAKLINDGNSNA